MKKFSSILMILVAMVFLASCGGGGSTESTSSSENQAAPEQQPQQEMQAAETTPANDQLALGKKIYDEKCVVCHQADAKGIQGAFPPLANSDYLLADPIRGIHQTLNGSHEEMTVNGVVYNAPMTPQVETKEEAVAVINYVLKEFNGYTDDKLLTIEDAKDVEINPMQQ